MKKRKDTETEIKSKSKSWLNCQIKKGVFSKVKFVAYSPYPFGQAGTPDWIGTVHGHFVGIEFKAEGKKPSKNQLDQMGEWINAGGFIFIVDSIEQFKILFNNVYKVITA